MSSDRDHVSVTLEVEGGFAYVPGLGAPFRADTDELAQGDAATLRELVASADFFAQPETLGAPPPGAADLRTYTVTVASGGRRHTVRAVEPIADPGVRDLVDQLVAWQRAAR